MTEEELTAQTNAQIDLIKKLAVNESFQAWVNTIVRPGIALLENDVALNADTMSEVVLRSRIKHIATLKMYFNDIFTILNQ